MGRVQINWRRRKIGEVCIGERYYGTCEGRERYGESKKKLKWTPSGSLLLWERGNIRKRFGRRSDVRSRSETVFEILEIEKTICP